ncbi:MAG: hypothetical protein EAZ09_17415 [Oscillatoriales cyanobacterium]|nr:MAG: hypothetical protein EAZ09_17415 [Oscillatoriales cyanobacterium]
MPVANNPGCPSHNQINSVEQASCLLLTIQDAHPTIKLTLCGTGILPVAKNLNPNSKIPNNY